MPLRTAGLVDGRAAADPRPRRRPAADRRRRRHRKTGTLQRAIVDRIEDGASPGEILCLTFTVEATKEMRRRVLAALSDREGIDPDELTVQTYHAFAASIVREHAPLIGLDVDAARPRAPVAARARVARPLHVQ